MRIAARHKLHAVFLALTPLVLGSAATAAPDAATQTVRGVTEVMPHGSEFTPQTEAQARAIPRPRIPGQAGDSRAVSITAKPSPIAPIIESDAAAEVVINPVCNTNTTTGFTPSDIHGAAGPTNIVVVTNVNISVRAKATCALVSNQSLISFFNSTGVPAGTTIFDPRVIYDTLSERFFATAESLNDNNNDQFQYVAVSTNSSGTAWHKYRIKLSEGATKFCKKTVDSFWDYPQAGVNNKRWFISANDFLATGGVVGALLAIDKTPTLSGGALTVRCITNRPFNLSVPIVKTTGPKAVMLSPGSGSGTSIARLDYTVGATLAADTIANRPSFVVPAWSAPPSAQMPNGRFLDSLDGRFQSQSVQVGNTLWNVHAVDRSGKSAARAYRLNASANNASTVSSSVTLCGTSNCSDHAFNPSIDTEENNDSAPLFVTISRTIPGSASASAKPGFLILKGVATLSGPFTANNIRFSSSEYTDCGASAGSPCRWGDYSSTQIDPSNGAIGWGFNQVITGPSQFTGWSTRAGRAQ